MNWVFHLPYKAANESSLQKIAPELCRNQKEFLACPAAISALHKMAEEAKKSGVHIGVISSWRSWALQKELFLDAERRHGAGRGILWVAPAGFSEHHTGYVLDLCDLDRPQTDDEPSFETTPASDWLKTHAQNFGFELSFPQNNIQGIGYEPWHWRYIGNLQSQKVFHPFFLMQTMRWIIAIVNFIRFRFLLKF